MAATVISTIEAKEQFSELLNQVIHENVRYILTRRGKEVAALVPLSDLHFLLAAESKHDLAEALESLKEARQEGAIAIEDFKEILS